MQLKAPNDVIKTTKKNSREVGKKQLPFCLETVK